MELTGIETDAIAEVMNIGAGHSATALSHLLNKDIDMSVPWVNVLPIEEVSSLVEKPEEPAFGIHLNITGAVRGDVLLLFPKETANEILSILGTGGDKETSTMTEIGNIAIGNHASALSDLLGEDIAQSIPSYSMDMAGSIFNTILTHLSSSASKVLVSRTLLTRKDEKAPIYLFVFLDEKSTKQLIGALNAKYGG